MRHLITAIFGIAAGLIPQVVQAVDATSADLLARMIRNPVIVVPLAEKAPTIDGTVDPQEWAGASLLPDVLMTFDENDQRMGLPGDYRARYWLQYTNDALYVAWRFELPEWSPKPRAEATEHEAIAKDDVLDFFLNPTGSQDWHLSGNGLGVTMDRNLHDMNVVYKWEPKTEYKARVFDGGWESEYKIPFSELGGRATPVANEKWRANFVSVRKTPFGMVSAWSYWRTWRHPPRLEHDGWIVFSGKPTGVQFTHGANEVQQHGIEFQVVGAKPDAPVKTDIKLFKRDGRQKPNEPSILAMLADWLDKTTVNGSDFWAMKYDAVVDLAFKQLKPVEGYVTIDKTEAGLDRVRVKPTDLGEYLMTYQITQGEGDALVILAAGALPFRVEEPVSLVVKPRMLTVGECQIDTDMRGVDLSKAKQLKVTVTPEGAAKPVAQQSADVKSTLQPIKLAAKDWPTGNYVLASEVTDASGAVLAAATEKMEKADLPKWWTQPEGLEPEVPEPWTPVQVEKADGGATVKIWGRAYRFNGLPVPAYIESTRMRLSDVEQEYQPQPLLASPIEINLTSSAKPLQWKNTKFEIVEQKPSQVIFDTENAAGGFILKGKTRVEFDGMIRVDLQLLSADGTPQSLEKLDLVIPFRPEIAHLLSNYRKAPGPGKVVNRYLGEVPKDPWKYGVFYTQFIGNNEMGLEWFCDNMKGWRIKKADEGTEVVRLADRTTETWHFVDHETRIEKDKPIAITFGLIATPTKPARRGWEIYRSDQNAALPFVLGDSKKGGETATQADVDAWLRRQKYTELKNNLPFWPNWTNVEWFVYPIDPSSEYGQKMKAKIDLAHSLGQRVGPHGGWISVSTLIPEWPLWGHEMVKEPAEGTLGRSFYACYNSPYTDFLVANFAANARSVGIDGVRFDTIAPGIECNSMYHGCGWHDENGQLRGSQNIFAVREFFKRIYRVFHGGVKKDGIVYFPLAGPPCMAFDSFVDVHEVGEGNFEKAATLKEGYPQPDVRVRMVGTAYGFVTSNNLKGQPLVTNERIGALIVAGADPRCMAAGIPAYHYRGYQKAPGWFPNTVEIWNAWKWIDRGRTSLWKPYWEISDELKLDVPRTAAGATPEFYGSFHYIPGKKVLLIVTNYEQEPLAGVKATLNLAKLGFPADAKLVAEDAITEEPVLYENGTVTVDVLSQRWRMVKLSAEAQKYAADRLGENLLPAGAFESAESIQMIGNPQGQAEPFAQLDTSAARSGKSSLRSRKTVDQMNHRGYMALPAVNVEPGNRYLVSGYLRIDEALKPALEGTNPRDDGADITIAIEGPGLISDPPQEFSRFGGAFWIGERTPGWMRFMIPFDATKDATTLTLKIAHTGIGTAWIDDVQVQKVTMP